MADPEVTLESLAKEVSLLRDRQDISDCVHRYARGVDRHLYATLPCGTK